MVFLFDTLAEHFHVSKASVVYTLTLTLAMRPLGALFFGALADRFGRRRPLIFCVLYFSALTVLTGLAPNYVFFVVCRALYGIGMGGYWGIGASYAMEMSPRRFRGVLSGMMQAGYPMGYLLAAVAMQTLTPTFGWKSVFFVGAPVAVLIVVLTLFAPESEAWKQHRPASMQHILQSLVQHKGMFFYLLADDERNALPFARYAGSVSRFSEIHPRNRGKDHLRNEDAVWNTHSVQHRRNRWGAYFRPPVAKARKTQRHHVSAL